MSEIPLIQLPKAKTKGYETVSLYVGRSTYDEPKNKPGINHLLEHILMTNDNVDRTSARMGLEQNAETHPGYVRFWFSTPRKHLNFCVKYLVKIASRPKFTHIKRESHAIRQELISLLEDTEYYSENAIIKRLFPNSGYYRGNDVKLMLSALPRISNKKVLQKYFRENYRGNMFIVASSGKKLPNFKPLKHVPKRFVSRVPKMCPQSCKGPDVIHIQRPEVEKSQCNLIFYTTSFEGGNKARHSTELASRILSNGLDSLLYKILRDTLRLVYSVSCDVEIEPYGIVIDIKWSCDTKKVERCVSSIKDVLNKFNTHHFIGHKTLYIEHLRRGNSLTSKDIVDLYGDELVSWGKYQPVEKILGDVRKITRADVVKCVRKYMDFERCFLVHVSSNKRAPISSLR